MAKSKRQADSSPEIDAISAVYTALKGLDSSAQLRVLRYSAEMLGIAFGGQSVSTGPFNEDGEERGEETVPSGTPSSVVADRSSDDDIDGINPVALKWMRRSDLNPKGLQSLFSLGIDDIDLVAKSVPGDSKKERMRSVLLLKGIAAYLGTGAARFTFEQLKEASLHYDAYDSTNFAKHLKSFNADVGGTKEAGFTLTARGLTSATELIKGML